MTMMLTIMSKVMLVVTTLTMIVMISIMSTVP